MTVFIELYYDIGLIIYIVKDNYIDIGVLCIIKYLCFSYKLIK